MKKINIKSGEIAILLALMALLFLFVGCSEDNATAAGQIATDENQVSVDVVNELMAQAPGAEVSEATTQMDEESTSTTSTTVITTTTREIQTTSSVNIDKYNYIISTVRAESEDHQYIKSENYLTADGELVTDQVALNDIKNFIDMGYAISYFNINEYKGPYDIYDFSIPLNRKYQIETKSNVSIITTNDIISIAKDFYGIHLSIDNINRDTFDMEADNIIPMGIGFTYYDRTISSVYKLDNDMYRVTSKVLIGDESGESDKLMDGVTIIKSAPNSSCKYNLVYSSIK